MPMAVPSWPEELENRNTIRRLHPSARGGKESIRCRGIAAPFCLRSVPDAQRLCDIPVNFPEFLEPRDRLTVGGIQYSMSQSHAAVRRQRCAFDMEAGPGPQLLREPRIDPPRHVPAPRQVSDTQRIGKIRLRLLQTVEVVTNREMFRDVALPRWHRAPVGLDPTGHVIFTSFCSTARGGLGVTPGNRLPQPVFATSPT